MSFLGGNPIRSSLVLSSNPPPEPHVPKIAVRSQSTPPTQPINIPVKTSKSSNWLSHIKSYQTEHKVSYKEAMKMAKSTYKK